MVLVGLFTRSFESFLARGRKSEFHRVFVYVFDSDDDVAGRMGYCFFLSFKLKICQYCYCSRFHFEGEIAAASTVYARYGMGVLVIIFILILSVYH